jgi:hypothetical protein
MKAKIVLCFLLSLSFTQAQSNLPIVVSSHAATNFNSQKFNQTTNNPTQATKSAKCNQDSHGIKDGKVSEVADSIFVGCHCLDLADDEDIQNSARNSEDNRFKTWSCRESKVFWNFSEKQLAMASYYS